MEKKYIIELPEKYILERDNGSKWFQMPVTVSNHHELIIKSTMPLTPYTEDRYKLERRAYQRGYEAGYDDGYNEPGKNRQKAYKQEKEDIQVGDEVIAAFGKAVVTGVGPVHSEYVYADGSHGFDKVKNVKKTGRHFPELVEILKKMKGAE